MSTYLTFEQENKFFAALMAGDLTYSAVRVGFKILKGYRVDWGYCCYTQQEIADWLGISRHSVVDAVKELEDKSFIRVDREHGRKCLRNRYIPIFTDEVEPGSTIPEEFTQTNNNRVDPGEQDRVQSTEQPSTVVSTSSLQEPVSTLKEIEKEPIACPADRRQAVPDFISNWTEFNTAVIKSWRMPAGWDKWGFNRSVESFIRQMRRGCPAWIGLKLATLRLRKWLGRERYKTEHDYAYRGFNEWVLECSDE